MQLVINAISHKGGLPSNEDMILIGNDCFRNHSKSYELDFNTFDFPFMLAVADGLGGHEHGAMASEIVLTKIAKQVTALSPGLGQEAIKSKFSRTLYDINEHLLIHSKASEMAKAMASTFSGILFYERKIFLLHVGDSRIYRLSKNVLVRLTRDHSLQELTGTTINSTKAVLLNAVGGQKEMFIDFEEITPKLVDDDYLLLCTDGLTSELSETAIIPLLQHPQPHQLLCNEALKRNVQDNVSAIVVKYYKD
jgi:protein phosphatase